MEKLNSKPKLTIRKSYGLRFPGILEMPLFHALDKLPESKLVHEFYWRANFRLLRSEPAWTLTTHANSAQRSRTIQAQIIKRHIARATNLKWLPPLSSFPLSFNPIY